MSWLRSQLFWRILGTWIVLSLPALMLFAVPLNSRIADEVLQRFDEASVQKAETIGRLAQQADGPESLITASRTFFGAVSHDLYILSQSGQMLAKSESSGGTSIPASFIDSVHMRSERAESGTLRLPSRHDVVLAWTKVARPDSEIEWIVVLVENSADQDALLNRLAGKIWLTIAAIWASGVVSVIVAAQLVMQPLRSLIRALTAPDQSQNRADGLIRLTDRSDEFGELAQQMRTRDVERAHRLENLALAETALRGVVAQLRAVLENMVEGVIAIDRNERIIFANSVGCRMISTDPKTVEKRRAYEVIREPVLQEAIRETLIGGEDVSLELRLPRSETRVSVSITPFALGNDESELSSGLVIVLYDVSEIRRLEIMRRDMVSGVSHELKTPLTVIQACTETLLGGALDDPSAARRFLGQIEEQSERLLQLILGMLQLARVESGSVIFERRLIAVHDLTKEILRPLRTVAEGRQLNLSLSGASELFVLADEEALRTVISNLVDNAIKYTPDGGNVEIELVAEEHASAIVVRDKGIGIPEKDRSRVFERFYRVDRHRNRDRGGTGLGLAIVKHLCAVMSAQIQLDSQIGKGTEVTVRFPLDERVPLR